MLQAMSLLNDSQAIPFNLKQDFIPNHGSPPALAFLPPDIASQLQTARYLSFATAIAYILDWIQSFPDEYRLLIKSRPSPPVFVYFFSRFMTLTYSVMYAAFGVAPIANCGAFQRAVFVCAALAVPSTSMLFLLRIYGVFSDYKWIRVIFTTIWVTLLATTWTIPFGGTVMHIGPTQLCIQTGFKSWSRLPFVVNTANDTLIYLSLSSYLFWLSHTLGPWSVHITAFFKGTGMPPLMSVLLTGGQEYYLVTVGMHIAVLTLIYTPRISPLISASLIFPNFVLENTMACLVFRQLRLRGLTPPSSEPSFLSGGMPVESLHPEISPRQINHPGEDRASSEYSLRTINVAPH